MILLRCGLTLCLLTTLGRYRWKLLDELHQFISEAVNKWNITVDPQVFFVLFCFFLKLHFHFHCFMQYFCCWIIMLLPFARQTTNWYSGIRLVCGRVARETVWPSSFKNSFDQHCFTNWQLWFHNVLVTSDTGGWNSHFFKCYTICSCPLYQYFWRTAENFLI